MEGSRWSCIRPRGGLSSSTPSNEGEVLGWSWLVPPYRSGFATAVTPVSATALDGACLRGKCEADAELGYELLKRVTAVMYHRMQAARLRLLDLYDEESARKVRSRETPVKKRASAVGCQNSATRADLGFYAARSYSLMRPPRTGAFGPILGEVGDSGVGPGSACSCCARPPDDVDSLDHHDAGSARGGAPP